MEISIHTGCTYYSGFFLVCKLYKSSLQLCLLFQTILDFWTVLILEVVGSEILRRVSFNSKLHFSCFFLVFKLNKSGLYIITFWTQALHYLKVFSIQFFSAYTNLKSNHHLLFLAIFLDLKMIQFWSVNYVCQVCKLYFYFGHVQKFGQYLYLSAFSKQ